MVEFIKNAIRAKGFLVSMLAASLVLAWGAALIGLSLLTLLTYAVLKAPLLLVIYDYIPQLPPQEC